MGNGGLDPPRNVGLDLARMRDEAGREDRWTALAVRGDVGIERAPIRLTGLLRDLDPHHVGALVDTGHTAVNGGPIRLELDMVRPWLSLLAIKDMAWEKGKDGWKNSVVPAGEGIVHWNEVGQAVKECKFNGTISLHGEYETKDIAERKELAKRELALLKKQLEH